MGNIIQRSKGSVIYQLKDPIKQLKADRNKESLIFLRFSYGRGNSLKFSTGYKCSFNDWDIAKQRVKNKAHIKNKDDINEYLSGLENYIIKEYGLLAKEYEEVPRKLLRKKLKAFQKQDLVVEQPEEQLTFFQIIDKYIEERHGHISIVTERSYKQTRKRLHKFEKSKREKLSFDNIDTSFYLKFNAYMEKEGFALNTIGKHLKSIRTFCNYALDEGYTKSTKFQNKKFKIRKETTTEIYLTDEEIQQFFEKDLSGYPELERARDIFLIGCYTGQRVSDYNYLTKDDIVERDGIKYFKIKQKKNRKFSRVVFCPITKEMQEIMDKRHNGEPPATMPEPLLNEYIKQIGKDLGFTQRIKCEVTKGGKLVSEMVPKHELIKTHTARRSFCTNKYKAGMNVFDIMLFSGHSTEKEFYKYIRIKDEERAYHIAKNGFFNV